MKIYHISHSKPEEKEKNIELWKELQENADYIKTRWSGDYLITTLEYKDNKIYELNENMEYGIKSSIVEYTKEEYENYYIKESE
jgi:hypothetical protein